MNALVVDDVELDRRGCCEALESLYWEVLGAASFEEAIGDFEDGGQFDVVICDYDLKAAEDGLDLLEEVQRRQPSARRILMSGLYPKDVVAQAKESHKIHGFVEKPSTYEGWRRAFTSLVETRGGEQGQTSEGG